jgi:predicted ATPase
MRIFLKSLNIPKPAGETRFPFSIPLFRNGLEVEFKNTVTIFAGENASGKSTLLENLAVACGYPRQGGLYGHTVRKTFGTNTVGDTIEITPDNLELANHMKLTWRTKSHQGYFLRAEYMSETLAQHKAGGRYLSRSHGEGILEIVSDMFRDGLFILDEPETALSPTGQLALLSLIAENVRRYDAQYIIVTHSPILMGIPASDFYWIDGGAFRKMDYTDAPHFQITKAFCDHPARLIDQMK